LEVLRDFHEAIFPVRFEYDFFSQLAAGRLHTLGAYSGEDAQLIGIVVWDFVTSAQADEMDGPLLSRLVGSGVAPGGLALYIMTLGVRVDLRRRGLGRRLLQECMDSARARAGCVCAYLHTLSTNERAIRMYEKALFLRLHTVRRYY
ncbi:acyl-CoA N-acyltransferase, partial [Pavlovales sp. CCMP2436]